jgi:hypothetical protein
LANFPFSLPLLQSTEGIPSHDERAQGRFNGVTTLLLNNAEPIKLACYILPLLLALGYLNKLRVDAQRQAIIADGLRLDAQRQTAIENGLTVDAQDQQASRCLANSHQNPSF